MYKSSRRLTVPSPPRARQYIAVKTEAYNYYENGRKRRHSLSLRWALLTYFKTELQIPAPQTETHSKYSYINRWQRRDVGLIVVLECVVFVDTRYARNADCILMAATM